MLLQHEKSEIIEEISNLNLLNETYHVVDANQHADAT